MLGVIFLFLIFYFRVGILNNFSLVAHFVFRPALVLGNGIKHQFSYLGIAFHSKKALLDENENLKAKLSE